MKISDFLKVLGVITVMALLYTHLQMKIYSLAYEGKRRANHVDLLVENNALMRNDILRLRSSDHIGRQLLVKDKDYRFIGRQNVMEVRSAKADPLAGALAMTGLKF